MSDAVTDPEIIELYEKLSRMPVDYARFDRDVDDPGMCPLEDVWKLAESVAGAKRRFDIEPTNFMDSMSSPIMLNKIWGVADTKTRLMRNKKETRFLYRLVKKNTFLYLFCIYSNTEPPLCG